jgi:hypothetical protein
MSHLFMSASSRPDDGLVACIFALLCLYGVFRMFKGIVQAIVRRLLTPRGHRRPDDVYGSSGYQDLRGHGGAISVNTEKRALQKALQSQGSS